MNYGYGINGAIEQLDYTVHLTMGDHEECVRFFAEHPVFGTVGYASYEDAENDLHGFLGIGQFLDTCESMVNAGYDGDHFYFDRQEMLVEVRCDYWGWTWTPETDLVYDPQSKPVYPKNKSKRAVRIEQNKQHKGSDRAHGKKRMPSAKFVREADKQDIYHAHTKFVWHESHKGEWIPRTVRKHDKFRQERFVPSPDWDRTPDPLMPAERLECNQQIEQLKNQLDITDWEMRDVTDRIQWCREDIEEIEFMKSKEAEVRQALKEWQDRLDTLAREYHDLTERILNLSV